MRTARIIVDGAKYRVGAEINRQEEIFNKPENRELLQSYIKRARERFGFQVEDLSIKGYQFNMTINPKDEVEMAQIMKSILGGFAVKYNYLCGEPGHVWYGRFTSEPCIEDNGAPMDW